MAPLDPPMPFGSATDYPYFGLRVALPIGLKLSDLRLIKLEYMMLYPIEHDAQTCKLCDWSNRIQLSQIIASPRDQTCFVQF